MPCVYTRVTCVLIVLRCNHAGCFGSKRNENAFTILGQERNLELEAPSLSEKNDWVRAITYLIASRRGR